MTGTSTPRLSRSLRIISGTAAAAASVLTVTRTSWEPACASRATCSAVASASAVSVFVIDWTTIGWAEPTSTPPTSTDTVGRRRGRMSAVMPVSPSSTRTGEGRQPSARRAATDDVEGRDPDQEAEQQHEADEVRDAFDADGQPRSGDRLQEDHEDPATVERRERQDVHEREIGRQDPGEHEEEQRAAGPEDLPDLDGDADGSRCGRRLRRPIDDRLAELAEAVEDQTERSGGPADADGARRDRIAAERVVAERQRELRDPERATLGTRVGQRPERDLHVAYLTRRVRDGERDGPAGARSEIVDRGDTEHVAVELVVARAVDREDRVARGEAGGRRRGAGFD